MNTLPTTRTAAPPGRRGALLALAAALVPLTLPFLPGTPALPLDHYLPLHTGLEVAAMVLAAVAFVLLWLAPANALLSGTVYLGASLPASALLDFLHTLSYQGMPPLVTPSGPEKAIGFWLAGRTAMALGLAAVAWWPIGRRITRRRRLAVLGTTLAFALLAAWGLLLHPERLPRTFVPGQGLTPFKVGYEAVLIVVLGFTARQLWRRSRQQRDDAAFTLALAAVFAAVGEGCFSSYAAVSDLVNLAGHLCKLAAYGCLARAAFHVAVQQPLRESGGLAEALQATLNTALICDAAGIVRWVNPAFVAETGYAAAQAIGQPVALLGRVDDDPAAQRFADAVAAGRSFHGDVRMRKRDGQAYVDRRVLTPMRADNGYLTGFVMLGNDITERDRAQREAETIAARLAVLLDNAPDAIVVIDEHGRIEQANRQVTALFGYKPEELIGQNVAMLMPCATAQRHDGFLRRRREDHDRPLSVERDEVAQRRDGTQFPVHLSVGAAHLPGGNVYIGFLRDLSERQALQRQQLQSQKLEALGQLTGGIAHDFNNMLAGILGLASLGLQHHVPDPQSKLALYLREIVRTSERGRDLVAKMMAYARTSETQAAARPITVHTLVTDLLDMVRSSIPSTTELVDEIAADLSPVAIAAADVQQVVMNLVLNARDAVGEQGRIALSLRQADLAGWRCMCCTAQATGAHLLLSVCDDGPGIAEAVLPRIFDPFFTTKDVGKGTGLGLSSVLGIVHGAGGHLQVNRLSPHGTEIVVALPVCTAPG